MPKHTHEIKCGFNVASNALMWVDMPKPSCFHSHLRTGPLRDATAVATMRPWKYLVVMPNTGPIDTIEKMRIYRDELIEIRDKAGLGTEFIMTLYLTDALTPNVIEAMAKLPYPCAVKYYPPHKGATTGSGLGIPLSEAHETLLAMEHCGVRLLGHFESVFDVDGNELPQERREDYFMQHEFRELRDRHQSLKITIEHATTARAIERVREDDSGMTICGITPQAMILVRKDLNTLSWANHAKCMPIAKTFADREAVRAFAFSGDYRAHLGDDNAPHSSKSKLVPFGDAASGCFLPHSLALYAQLFNENDCLLHHFPAFACYNGPKAWGLPPPREDERIALTRSLDDIPNPSSIAGTDDVVIPFGWTIQGDALHPGLKLV